MSSRNKRKKIQYDLDKDNFPKHIYLNNETDSVSGVYSRCYDKNRKSFYYHNNAKKLYLFMAHDNMWTINIEYKPDTDGYVSFCCHVFKYDNFKLLDLDNQKWVFAKDGRDIISINIYDVKNFKKIGGSKTSSTQTSIDYKKLSKKDKRLLAKCGCTKGKESKKGKVMEDKIIMVKDDDNICSICRDELMFLDKKTELMCGHKFHTDCILRWITRNPTCPNCRNDHSEYIHKNEKKIVLTYNFRNNNNNDVDNEPDNNNTDSINSEQDNLITVGTNSITATTESEEPVSVTEMEQIQDMI
tara:strand:- start:377 stop:1276 length:900 start_codon:yes stop_codon:yes gene_type:complete